MNITSLMDYRARKSNAKAIHPSVWTPQDSVQTAQDFAAELDNAELGIALDEAASQPPSRRPRWSRHLFGNSRMRRAKIYDGLAVALLLMLAAVMGCIVVLASAPHAKADTGVARAYASEYGPAVCMTLDDYPSFGGIIGIAQSIVEDGLTSTEAGQVIGMSVADICPRHTNLIGRFALMFGPRQVA